MSAKGDVKTVEPVAVPPPDRLAVAERPVPTQPAASDHQAASPDTTATATVSEASVTGAPVTGAADVVPAVVPADVAEVDSDAAATSDSAVTGAVDEEAAVSRVVVVDEGAAVSLADVVDVGLADSDSVPPALQRSWRANPVFRIGSTVAWGLLGGAIFIALWALVSKRSGDLPGPWDSFSTLGGLLGDPFYNGGETDKGIGLQLATSLQRVISGFALAALVGVPFGLLLGGSRRAWQAANPVVQVLRPVSPLAWFPLGLVVFKNAPSAAIFVIFITALWPTVLNTAAGAGSVPQDQHNVARVFRFSRLSYVRHIVIPHSLPSIVTGLRLSMGIAWMVIVAVEMLSGGTGIGFYVWDSYNAGNLAAVISAILLIGCIGVILDGLFLWLHRLVSVKESGQ